MPPTPTRLGHPLSFLSPVSPGFPTHLSPSLQVRKIQIQIQTPTSGQVCRWEVQIQKKLIHVCTNTYTNLTINTNTHLSPSLQVRHGGLVLAVRFSFPKINTNTNTDTNTNTNTTRIQIQIHDLNLAAPGSIIAATPLPYLRSTAGQPAQIGRGHLSSSSNRWWSRWWSQWWSGWRWWW